MSESWMVESREDRALQAALAARLEKAWLLIARLLPPGADADVGLYSTHPQEELGAYAELKSRDLSLRPASVPDVILAWSKVRRLNALGLPTYFVLHAQREDRLYVVNVSLLMSLPRSGFERRKRRPDGRTLPSDREQVVRIPPHFFHLVPERDRDH